MAPQCHHTMTTSCMCVMNDSVQSWNCNTWDRDGLCFTDTCIPRVQLWLQYVSCDLYTYPFNATLQLVIPLYITVRHTRVLVKTWMAKFENQRPYPPPHQQAHKYLWASQTLQQWSMPPEARKSPLQCQLQPHTGREWGLHKQSHALWSNMYTKKATITPGSHFPPCLVHGFSWVTKRDSGSHCELCLHNTCTCTFSEL